MKKVIGIGTPRSGTRALAQLLQGLGLDVTHEGSSAVGWNREAREERYGQTRTYLQEHDGDVAYWLTSAATDLLSDFPEAKVVSLKREKGPLLESLRENMEVDRLRERRSLLGFGFPTYPDLPEGEAWEAYWQAHRQRVGTIKSAYGGRVLEIETEALGKEDTKEEIATFLEI